MSKNAYFITVVFNIIFNELIWVKHLQLIFSVDTSNHNTCSRSACFSEQTIKRCTCKHLFLISKFFHMIVDDGKFKFSPDNVYVYKHTIRTQTTFDKSKNTALVAEFTFNVHIHIKDCDGFLFVSELDFYL